ncbi:MAG: hypothetical protein K5848_02275 [Lachnospiraceae bacterium]|nr:hypothetical protein [Lachnospiraceae bacterium]
MISYSSSNKAIAILQESLDGALDNVRRINVFGGETLISDESAYKIVGFENEAVN